MSVDQASWEAAVRHLFEDAYPYDATGPRRHEDWVLDLLPLMARVPDPRGWVGLDDAAQDPERAASPTYPFVAHPRTTSGIASVRSTGTVPRTCSWPSRTTAARCPT